MRSKFASWFKTPEHPKTKRRILEAAADVFSEKGYHASAVDDIVRASDTSKGSFYHFFRNKQGIFLTLVDHMYSKLLQRIESAIRSEEHTSELQSRGHLVCRILLEKNNLTSTP